MLAAMTPAWAAGSTPAVGAPHPPASGSAMLTSVTSTRAAAPAARDQLTVTPLDVPAAGPHSLEFRYTTATQAGHVLIITIDVPPGWTPPVAEPPAAPADPGAVSVDCLGCDAPNDYQVAVKDHEIKVMFRLAKPVATDKPAVIITYSNATPPGPAGAVTFDATEQPAPQFLLRGGTSAAVAFDPTPVVMVTCADGTGAMHVSPAHVIAGGHRLLTFSYQPAGGCALNDGALSLAVPSGWTPPSLTPGTAGYITAVPGSVSVSGATVTVTGVTLPAGEVGTITYHDAAAPDVAATAEFVAAEQSAESGSLTLLPVFPKVAVMLPRGRPTPTDTPTGSPPATRGGATITPTPTVTVTGQPPVSSTGTMTVAPGTVTAGHPSPLTFTYRAPAGGLSAAGAVTLTVPHGWSPPSTAPGSPGYTSAAPGAARVSGRRIEVTGVQLAPGQPLTISYHPTVLPGDAGSSTFDSSERPSTAAVLTALTDSPSVEITGPSPFHIPATVGFILLAAACAAGLTAARFLRRRRPGPSAPAPELHTVPHAGPPATVTVQPSRTEATHTMRIEPHRAAAVTTIEESRS